MYNLTLIPGDGIGALPGQQLLQRRRGHVLLFDAQQAQPGAGAAGRDL